MFEQEYIENAALEAISAGIERKAFTTIIFQGWIGFMKTNSCSNAFPPSSLERFLVNFQFGVT